MLTDSYTGIAPASVAAFVAAQLAAGLLAAPVAVLFQSHRVSQQAST
jgi:hypothetical protein